MAQQFIYIHVKGTDLIVGPFDTLEKASEFARSVFRYQDYTFFRGILPSEYIEGANNG